MFKCIQRGFHLICWNVWSKWNSRKSTIWGIFRFNFTKSCSTRSQYICTCTFTLRCSVGVWLSTLACDLTAMNVSQEFGFYLVLLLGFNKKGMRNFIFSFCFFFFARASTNVFKLLLLITFQWWQTLHWKALSLRDCWYLFVNFSERRHKLKHPFIFYVNVWLYLDCVCTLYSEFILGKGSTKSRWHWFDWDQLLEQNPI